MRKYDADGNELWTRQFGTSSYDDAYGVSADASGVYVVGQTYGTFPRQTNLGGYDAFVRKYNADGHEVWTTQFGTSGSDLAYGISVDGSGVYVTGGTSGIFPGQTSSGSMDAFVVNILPPVTVIDAVNHLIATVESMNLQQGIENSLDVKLEAARDALFAANAGNRNDAINKLEAFVNAVEAQRGKQLTDEQADELVSLANDIISTLGGATAAPALAEDTPSEWQLAQNYPNPFNPDTWIPYQLGKDANVVISVYSPTGQLIRRLDLGHKAAGFYTSRDRAVHWDGRNQSGERVSSGVYFYHLQAGSYSAIKRMLIVK